MYEKIWKYPNKIVILYVNKVINIFFKYTYYLYICPLAVIYLIISIIRTDIPGIFEAVWMTAIPLYIKKQWRTKEK